jgi:hypothetical protein
VSQAWLRWKSPNGKFASPVCFAQWVLAAGGDPPDSATPPAGCRFHRRCWLALDRCSSEEPAMRRLDQVHACACHLVNSNEIAPVPCARTSPWAVANERETTVDTVLDRRHGKWEPIYRHGPWRGLDDVEFVMLSYVDWFNHRRLHGEILGDPGYATRPPFRPSTTVRPWPPGGCEPIAGAPPPNRGTLHGGE